jgi:glycosyltransferase involved in cell wall biosynthesis
VPRQHDSVWPCQQDSRAQAGSRQLPHKLRVLFAIGDMAGGGSQRQLLGMLRLLDRSRFVPHLYLVSPGGELLPDVPADVPVYIFRDRPAGRQWLTRGHAWWNRILAFRARIADLAAVIREQQIDVVYDRTYHMTLAAGPAARRTRARRVSVIVADPKQDFDTNHERFAACKHRQLRRAYHTADRVVAVSNGVRQAAIDYYGLPVEKIVTLHNFFDIERIDRQMQEPLPPADVKRAGCFEIVAAGRLHPQKGFGYLLDAVRDLVQGRGRTQVHLRVLGSGPLEAELRTTISRQALQSHVTLTGFRHNPLPYFRQADLFCLSSLYEGHPNALVEAMLCGLPVLATDCPSGPREILAGGKFGRLVPPANPRALADAIEDALLHYPQWQSHVAAARTHIVETYSPAAGIQRLQDLLLSVAQ